MRSKISTLASTAMPMDSTNPASPGSVSTASKPASIRQREQHVEKQSRHRERAREPVVADDEHDEQNDGDDSGASSPVDRILAEAGADRCGSRRP